MILIVGAAGNLGGQITDRLLQRGAQVKALTRRRAAVADRWPAVEGVDGDLKEPESLRAACAGVDTVITTANATSRGAPDTIESVDLTGNLNSSGRPRKPGFNGSCSSRPWAPPRTTRCRCSARRA